MINFKALQQAQAQSLAATLARQQSLFKTQLAAGNQQRLSQNLALQAQAHIDGARTAQQNLSGAGSALASSDPQTTLGALSRQRLDDLRLAALRRAGIT